MKYALYNDETEEEAYKLLETIIEKGLDHVAEGHSSIVGENLFYRLNRLKEQ